jgi:hypothetical protein
LHMQSDQEMSHGNSDSNIDSRPRKSAVGPDNSIPNFKIPMRKEQLCDEPANEN